MFFKDEIVIGVYNLYINGTPLEVIAYHWKLKVSEVDEIIDHVNSIIL